MKIHDNVSRYPWYRFFRDCYFWGPAFFLYFTSVLTLEQALWLEGVYYVSVAALEVPSGYLSDRLGRKCTLVFSSACLAAAFLVFFLGKSFAVFALAQVLMACGYASASGTDTALLFESLKQAGREDEYTHHEARALKFTFRAGAMGALGGGLLALVELKWIYGASCLAALVSMGLALTFTEPGEDSPTPVKSMGPQVKALMKKSMALPFRFFTLYTVGMTLLIHFPYEFYQPYLDRVVGQWQTTSGLTPLVTGFHLAATALVGSFFTRFATPRIHGCEIRRILMGTALFQVLLIALMAAIVHPAMVILLVGRTLARALTGPLVNAQVSPLLKREERSTFLSLQSLMGRLGYGVVLWVLPLGSRLFSDALTGSLFWAAVVGLGILLLLKLTPSSPDAPCCRGHHGHGHGHSHH